MVFRYQFKNLKQMINQLSPHSIILVTGDIRYFEQKFVAMSSEKYSPKNNIIFSCDEMKKWEIAKLFQGDFVYDSVINSDWMSAWLPKDWIKKIKYKLGAI